MQGFARNNVAVTGGSKDHKLAIYGMDASGNVAPILMLLNECNIDYDFKFTNLMTGANKTRTCLACQSLFALHG